MRSSWRNSSQAERRPPLLPVLSRSRAWGLARKTSSRLCRPSTSLSRAITLSDGWRLPASRWPIYGVEVLIRLATSSCVRSSWRRRSRMTAPKVRWFALRIGVTLSRRAGGARRSIAVRIASLVEIERKILDRARRVSGAAKMFPRTRAWRPARAVVVMDFQIDRSGTRARVAQVARHEHLVAIALETAADHHYRLH